MWNWGHPQFHIFYPSYKYPGCYLAMRLSKYSIDTLLIATSF